MKEFPELFPHGKVCVRGFKHCGVGPREFGTQDFGALDSQPMDKLAETWNMPMHKIVISSYIRDLVREHCRQKIFIRIDERVFVHEAEAPLWTRVRHSLRSGVLVSPGL